jgi:fatty aldehyde-generating acyl-ACP reductase
MNTGTQNTHIDFALLGHPASYEHMGDIFTHSRPDFNREKLTKYRATLEKIFEWTPSYASQDLLLLPLANGRQVSGRLIFCNFLPETIHSPRKMLAAYQKIHAGCNVAKNLGAKVVGLGGFTSIIGGTQGEKESQELGIAITSGNSLTAALAIAQLNQLLSRLDWDLVDRTVAVVGASGDIGRACALALAPRARQMLLIARNRAKLEELRDEMPAGVEIHICTDVQDAAHASVIIAATSASQPILSEADLQPGTVVCDVGYPKNLSYASDPRPEVLAISGGLAEMPFALDITYYTQLPTPTIMYGCFSEAMILAMAGRYESYSIGQGRITQEKMEHILALAQTYGFRPAPLFRGKTPVTDETLSTFLQHSYQPKEAL